MWEEREHLEWGLAGQEVDHLGGCWMLGSHVDKYTVSNMDGEMQCHKTEKLEYEKHSVDIYIFFWSLLICLNAT